MEKKQKIEILKAIAEIENPYPKNNLISSYGDFLKVRNYLPYYKFNPIVFDELLQLVLNEWESHKRINRLSLLQSVKQYFRGALDEKQREYYSIKTRPHRTLGITTRKKVFDLFRKVFEESKYISTRQLDEARKICNYVLINLELTPVEEEWLCSNISASELILNRVLRYPVQSTVITTWAKSNFKNDCYRHRRAELVGWVIDETPDFEVDQQTLIDDFDYLNQCDLQAIQNYDDEVAANKIMEQELGEYLPKRPYYSPFDDAINGEEIDLSLPELTLSKRPYSIPIDSSKSYPVRIPDFDFLKHNFYNDLAVHQKITMIWAIAYARIDNKLKFALLKKYYCKETYYSLYRICKRTNNLALLKWMLQNQ